MLANVQSVTHLGLNAQPIDIETDMSNGLPGFVVVGLANKAIEESKEHVRSAIKNSGLNFPPKRITVNLAPADLAGSKTIELPHFTEALQYRV